MEVCAIVVVLVVVVVALVVATVVGCVVVDCEVVGTVVFVIVVDATDVELVELFTVVVDPKPVVEVIPFVKKPVIACARLLRKVAIEPNMSKATTLQRTVAIGEDAVAMAMSAAIETKKTITFNRIVI